MPKPFLAVVAALWPLPAQPMHPHRPPHPFLNHPALFRMRASQNNRIMNNGRLLLILIVAAASGCAGADYAISPTPPVPTPSGPTAGSAADISMNVAKVAGVTFPSGGGFGFGCGGGSLLPGQTPADVASPQLAVEARSGISGVVVDSILHTSEQGAAVRRFMFTDLGPLGTGSISLAWGGDSPLIAQTESAARVQFTVAGVVYYHRGPDHFVSPKVSYSCDP